MCGWCTWCYHHVQAESLFHIYSLEIQTLYSKSLLFLSKPQGDRLIIKDKKNINWWSSLCTHVQVSTFRECSSTSMWSCEYTTHAEIIHTGSWFAYFSYNCCIEMLFFSVSKCYWLMKLSPAIRISVNPALVKI